MPFNVNEFRAQMQLDGARPNLFQFSMPFPTEATGGGANNLAGGNDATNVSSKFTFMARAGQMPGSTVNPIPVMYFGRELKFSGNRTFPEWTVTIMNDEDFVVRNTFEKWMSALNSHVTNVRSGSFPNQLSYSRDITVTQFSKFGTGVTGVPVAERLTGIKKYKLVGAFPIDVSPIELDWGANDQIEEFTVTFSYQWWESDTTETAYTA
jgi:hypothetical protein